MSPKATGLWENFILLLSAYLRDLMRVRIVGNSRIGLKRVRLSVCSSLCSCCPAWPWSASYWPLLARGRKWSRSITRAASEGRLQLVILSVTGCPKRRNIRNKRMSLVEHETTENCFINLKTEEKFSSELLTFSVIFLCAFNTWHKPWKNASKRIKLLRRKPTIQS